MQIFLFLFGQRMTTCCVCFIFLRKRYMKKKKKNECPIPVDATPIIITWAVWESRATCEVHLRRIERLSFISSVKFSSFWFCIFVIEPYQVHCGSLRLSNYFIFFLVALLLRFRFCQCQSWTFLLHVNFPIQVKYFIGN